MSHFSRPKHPPLGVGLFCQSLAYVALVAILVFQVELDELYPLEELKLKSLSEIHTELERN